MMGKRVAAAALLLALTALLTGCAATMEERQLADLAAMPPVLRTDAPLEDACAPQEETVMLYFLDEEGMELVPVPRTLVLEGGSSVSEAALRLLMQGPMEDENAFWPELGALHAVRGYELSGGVATVNLPARARALGPEELYAVRMAITQTLTEFAEVAYVNVLVGGREEGFDLAATMPVGALSRAEDLDVAARYLRQDELRQSAQDAGISRMTTLHFPSEDGRYILPEVRSIAYAALTPIEYLYTILAELGKGTEQPLAMNMPAPMKYIEEMPEIGRTEGGMQRAIDIRFDAALDEALESAGIARGLYLALLTDTLMGFVPGVEGLRVTIGGELVTLLGAEETPHGEAIALAEGLCTRDVFAGMTGAPGTIYLPARETGKLTAETCVFAQAKQHSARAKLEQLTRALCAVGALEDGLTEADILAVHCDETRIRVNLSAAYGRSLAALTPAQERIAVYAMVNTLTEQRDAQRVAFYIEGAQVETLAGGLAMQGDFVRNPGMVVTK